MKNSDVLYRREVNQLTYFLFHEIYTNLRYHISSKRDYKFETLIGEVSDPELILDIHPNILVSLHRRNLRPSQQPEMCLLRSIDT